MLGTASVVIRQANDATGGELMARVRARTAAPVFECEA